jgi:hypothetical protein
VLQRPTQTTASSDSSSNQLKPQLSDSSSNQLKPQLSDSSSNQLKPQLQVTQPASKARAAMVIAHGRGRFLGPEQAKPYWSLLALASEVILIDAHGLLTALTKCRRA